MAEVRLPFTVDAISNPGSRSFCVNKNATELAGFVVRQGESVYAYHNRCPHTGVALNWAENVFLDSQEEFIQCTMHGAMFTIQEGYCLRGPCVGKSLDKIRLMVDSCGRITVEI